MTLISDPDALIPPRDGGPPCDYCQNRRFVLDAHGNLKPCPRCSMVQRWRMETLRAFSSRSARSALQTFDNFQIRFEGSEEPTLKLALREARAFAQDCAQAYQRGIAPQSRRRWLVLFGERGVGKSHLCAAVDNALQAAEVPTLFITAPEMLNSLYQALHLRDEDENDSFEWRKNIYKTASVLILDDLAAEASSPWNESVLLEILDYRYRNLLWTMIATNTRPSDFEARLASRLQDTLLCSVVEISAQDYRLRQPAQRKDAARR
ncbi:MAG: ATP-binding protein [Anaerolineae bacterium]|nr:ATP-binding protein [Anaerolineae bacterium]